MKTITKKDVGEGAVLLEKEIPQIQSNEVLVKVLATSICGTDLHVFSWDEWSKNRILPPRVMGHEFAGKVIEVGEGVTRIKVGDIVSAETHNVCGKCEMCRTGKAHVCTNTEILGVDTDGSFAEYVAIPEQNAWVNDPNIPPKYLCIQEPLGNAVHTVLSGEIIGKTIAIIGCGPIGMMAVAIAKAVGASKVIAVEVNEFRLNLVKEIGADITINPLKEDVVKRVLEETEGMGVDVVAEISGNPSAIQQAFKYIKLGGRMSMLGIPTKEVSIDVANGIVFKGIQIHGIVGRKMYNTWYQVKGLLASGNLKIDKIITHILPLEEFSKGMDLMRSGNCGKVILLPQKK